MFIALLSTLKIGRLEKLENKFTTYKNYFNRIIESKLQKCENGDK